MDIFISWSGERARKFAEELGTFLNNVIQILKPWISDKDIDKGDRWADKLNEKLENTDFGIICLTPENLNAPWILFEAGALSKFKKSSSVCPILLDFEPTLLKGPLLSFQWTAFNKEDMFKLMKSINKSLKEESLEENRLKQYFEKWWPDLESAISKIGTATEKVKPKRTDRDIIEETLDTVRRIERQLSPDPLIKIWDELAKKISKNKPEHIRQLELDLIFRNWLKSQRQGLCGVKSDDDDDDTK